MAESKGNNAGIAMHFDVVKQPQLLIICDGDVEKTVAFPGTLAHDMTSAEVEKWLEAYHKEFSTGCAQVRKTPKMGTKLDRSTDLNKMKVSQIKALMDAHAIPCVSCYEKSDFVSAIKTWLDANDAPKKRAQGAEYMATSFSHDDF